MPPRNSCSHMAAIADIPVSDIISSKEHICEDCDCQGPNLWICLRRGCYKIGCSENYNDHSTLHNRTLPQHCIHMNLSTHRLWCYQCEQEVFMDQKLKNNDSEEESYDRTTRDSGRGSYSTLRTDVSERSSILPTGFNGDSSDSDDNSEQSKPRGLVGLQNIGNTCYMNAALQALSNTPPLTGFFLECPAVVQLHSEGRKPGLSRSYQHLVRDMWRKRTQGCVTPSGILYGIRNVHAMFRGYHQHDTQEFLRCFMDQLHEELKQPMDPDNVPSDDHSGYDSTSQSEGEYETCDSGVSERSSLSDETERPSKRRRSASPRRLMTKLISNSSSVVVDAQPSSSSTSSMKKQEKYRSIISDVFDGKLLSTVQCLTCNRVSSRVETFQDLSLPIPSRDHLAVLHGGLKNSAPPPNPPLPCSDAYVTQDGWMAWLWAWLRSWFYGPSVSLHDCLAAFFSADELKGDNMYSCEKCNKLRNGVKYSRVLTLPEVLCIHLKRFRHELMYSSKISAQVSFPLVGLDMRPYIHQDCASSVTSYDLASVICHHGTAGGGHYTCYSLNTQANAWFEFDDQYVTRVSPETVANSEAYVLFYRKSDADARIRRSRCLEIMTAAQSLGEMQFYVSKQWINRFNTCAEPGPIDNSDFLCVHGGVSPDKASAVEHLATILPQNAWDYLYEQYGGGPPCTRLYECSICTQAAEALQRRISHETETFVQLNREMQGVDSSAAVYAISMQWFRQWQAFVRNLSDPPGPVDNSSIALPLDAVRPGSDYAQITEELWNFFHGIYGGGPKLRLRPPKPVPSPEETSSPQITEVEISEQLKGIHCHGEPVEAEPIEEVHEDSSDLEELSFFVMQMESTKQLEELSIVETPPNNSSTETEESAIAESKIIEHAQQEPQQQTHQQQQSPQQQQQQEKIEGSVDTDKQQRLNRPAWRRRKLKRLC